MTTPAIRPPVIPALSPLDLSAVGATMRALTATITEWGRTMAQVMEKVAVTINHLARGLVELANDPVRVAGLQARYYVRGALDPAYADPVDREAAVSQLLLGHGDDALLLTPQNRSLVATAFITGWNDHRADTDHPTYPWHRHIGGTTITVGGAA